MAVEDWMKLTPPELIKLRHSLGGGTPDGFTVDRILEQKIAESQLLAAAKNAEAGDHLAELTGSLVKATTRLVAATIAVAIVTAVVAIVTAIPLIIKCAQ